MASARIINSQLHGFRKLSPLLFGGQNKTGSLNTSLLQKHQDSFCFTTRDFSESVPESKINVEVDYVGVRKILINRPEAKNAMSFEMMDEIGTILNESNTDDATKLVTITGAGDFFTSGNDLSNWNAGTVQEVQEKTRKYVLKKLMYGFIDCRKPVIAMVNGGAVGAGATMLPFCDLVLASDKAFFHTPFPALYIVPEFCSSLMFPKVMGLQRANNMLIFGHKLGAKEALDCGFVNKVFPAEQFEAACDKLVQAYIQLPFDPLISTKEVIRGPEREKLRHLCAYEMDLVIEAAASPDLQANLKKFFAKKNKPE